MGKNFLGSASGKTFFTVGPSQIYPTIPSHMENAVRDHVLSLSHRGSEFKEIYRRMDEGLRKLLNIPSVYEIVVLSSALEAMERVLLSMSHNSTYHILTGNFGETWMGIASDLCKSPSSVKYFDWKKNENSYQAIKLSSYKEKEGLETIKIPKKAELVCLTQNDTSVGFSLPMSEIYKLRQKYPDKLFALDIVSSVPYVDIEYKYLDAVFFSVQKGFGMPAGLGLLVLSPNALKKAEKLSKIKGYSIGSYHNLVKMASKARQFQTIETPNVLGIYLLGCVISDFLKVGISKIRSRLEHQAHMLYSFFSEPESYSDKQDVVGEPFIKDGKYRAVTTPVFEIVGGSDGLKKFAGEKGLVLGAGYKDFKNRHLRIGNFPALQRDDFEKLLKTMRRFKV